MPREHEPAAVGVLLSGGLDSSVLLARLLADGSAVQPLYIRSGVVWESFELAAVGRLCGALTGDRLRPLVTLELPVHDLYREHWSLTGENFPDASTPDEAVFLPGRNALLIVKAAIWCQLNGVWDLALALLGTNPFADATPAFFEHLAAALNEGASRPLRILRPFDQKTKREVMELGRRFPLQHTFSCIAPQNALHCGRCNKCEERRWAFRAAGIPDPTPYDFHPKARDVPQT